MLFSAITTHTLNYTKEMMDSHSDFDLQQYFDKMDPVILAVLRRAEKDNITYDILDTENTRKYKQAALKDRHLSMKKGEIWQAMIGNYTSFVDLKVGHPTGLDIISEERKIAMELKNRTNTDNHSSRKTNFQKLARFKKDNPDYTCVYANINEDTEAKTLNSREKPPLQTDGVEIEIMTGMTLLRFIFGENAEAIIEFTRNTIDKYYLS